MAKLQVRFERGQGIIEYVVIIALIGAISTMSMSLMGIGVRDVYCDVLSGLGGDGCSFIPEKWNSVKGHWKTGDPLCGGPGEGRIFADDFSGEDYIINIDSAQLYQGNGYGVFFRTTNEDHVNGYNFQYDPGWGGGAFLFRKWVNGHELPPIAVARAPGFEWHNTDRQITVSVVGDTFQAYVDGELVLTATDDTYSEGGVGLRTWDNTEACFSGISITNP